MKRENKNKENENKEKKEKRKRREKYIFFLIDWLRRKVGRKKM